MAAVKNKVKFGLRNCHYALATMDDSQSVTFSTPVSIPGAVFWWRPTPVIPVTWRLP